MNFNVDLMGGLAGGFANSTVTTANLSVLQCPSESKANPLRVFVTGIYYGYTNYAGNFGGPGPISIASGTIIPVNNRILGSASQPGKTAPSPPRYPTASWGPVSIASITDGTSNTGLISERQLGQSNLPATLAGAGGDKLRCEIHAPVGAAFGSGAAAALAMQQSCANAPGSSVLRYCATNGQMWAATYPAWLTISSYNHFGTPNQVSCTNDTADGATTPTLTGTYYVTPMGSAPPSSFHPGGVNEAFADGSVHFVKNTISALPWWGLGTRNGGEVISADSY